MTDPLLPCEPLFTKLYRIVVEERPDLNPTEQVHLAEELVRLEGGEPSDAMP